MFSSEPRVPGISLDARHGHPYSYILGRSFVAANPPDCDLFSALVTYWEVVPDGFEPFPDWRPLRLPTIHIKAPTMP